MSALIATLRANTTQISSKLNELRQLLAKTSITAVSDNTKPKTDNDKMDDATLIATLRQENEQLKQQIALCVEQFKKLDARRSELLPASKTSLPLPTPKVLKTSKVEAVEPVSNDTPVTNAGDAVASDQNKKPNPKQNRPAKEAKPKKEKAAANPEPVNEKVDASRLKLVVGKIVDVQKHPDAEKLYVEQIELGEAKPRTIISGLVDYVPIEQMQNRLVVVLANLKPVKMRGILSEGMVMCASNKEANQVQPLSVPEGAQPGDRFEFAQYPGQPDDLLNPKKKIFEQVSPDLMTDANGVATYKGDPFVIPGKGVASVPGMPGVPVR